MKITKPDVIKNGEKNFMEGIKDDLDLDAVKKILNKKIAEAALSPKDGEIVVYKNKIAFKMNFDFHLRGSLMFDRQGNHIPESNQSDDSAAPLSAELDDSSDTSNSSQENDMQIELPDYESDGNLDLESEESDFEGNQLIEEDDDINDILDESREFWEQKKES